MLCVPMAQKPAMASPLRKALLGRADSTNGSGARPHVFSETGEPQKELRCMFERFGTKVSVGSCSCMLMRFSEKAQNGGSQPVCRPVASRLRSRYAGTCLQADAVRTHRSASETG